MPITIKNERYAIRGDNALKEEVEARQGGKWADGVAFSIREERLAKATVTDFDGLSLDFLSLVRKYHQAAQILGERVQAYREGRASGEEIIASELPLRHWSEQWDAPGHLMGALSRMTFDGALRWFRTNGIPGTAHVAASNSLFDSERDGVMVPHAVEGQKRIAEQYNDYLSAPVAGDAIMLGLDGTGMDPLAAQEFLLLQKLDEKIKDGDEKAKAFKARKLQEFRERDLERRRG